MAAFEHVRDMNDVALRPRMLRTVVREHVPDEKRPLGSPSQLSKVISMVKTHRLLSETVGDPTDQKLVANWKSSMDSWLERLSELVSNDMPDKCWAGICLLGVTCQECSSDRFLVSYSVWFQKLLSHIQLPEASHFVKVSSCASMSDLLTRLRGFPNVKKDGVGRVIPAVLKLLNDDQSEPVWDGAINLLYTIITLFPSSISRHYESVETVIASKFFSGNCSSDMLKKLAYCLALLPISRGDEDSWSLMMQKILLCINRHVNDTFQGFEEDNKSHEVVRLLVQPGKDPPPPLGELTVSLEPSSSKKRPESLSTSSASALMLCCCRMLTSSYPVQVTVPVRSLLLLVERVLTVNGSVPNSQRPFVTSLQQELLSSELPVLHQYSLDLLIAIIKSVRSQILPHAASIVRLISTCFKKCGLPELRTKIYSIAKMLLISMGVGMAIYLAQEVVNNAFVDLSTVGFGDDGTSSSANLKPSTESLQHPSRKKRKHGALEEARDGSRSEVGALKSHTPNMISLRIAALEAVESLLTVGGALKSEGWRSNLDLLLINTAKNSLKEGWAPEGRNIFEASEPVEIWANVQLAALRALLASFLSSRIRSPYLSQGLAIFREGKQETGTKLAEFCAHALLATEVLIHPRNLQVEDFPNTVSTPDEVSHRYPENTFSGNLHHRTPFSDSDHHDDLSDTWLENGKEPKAIVTDPRKTLENSIVSKVTTSGGSDKDIQEQGDADTVMVESVQPNQNLVSENVSSVPAITSGPTGDTMVLDSVTLDIGSLKQTGDKMALNEDVVVASTDGFKPSGTSSTSVVSDKGKNFSYEIDNESDLEDFPDIVIADPDSD